MKRISAMAMFILIIYSLGFSQEKTFLDRPFLETIANVDTLVIPDRIYLDISLLENDTKGKVSVEELEMKMISALKTLGLDTKKDLTLNDLGSNFNKYFLKQQDVLKIKSYSLVVENALTAGRVILALEKIEISNIQINKTEYSKMEQLRLDLKSKAVLKAKMQAESMVNPLDQKIGNAIYISDLSDNYNAYTLEGRAAGIIVRGASSLSKNIEPADIQFEKIKVSSTVNVKFILE